jgi:hypothetical protein
MGDMPKGKLLLLLRHNPDFGFIDSSQMKDNGIGIVKK